MPLKKFSFKKFAQLGNHPDDTLEIQLKKSSLMVMAGPFALAGLIWGLMYFAKGLIVPGLIPFCYGLLSISSVLTFIKTKKFIFFRNSQLFLILILPFSLQISLGGFIPSSSVIMWAMITPAGALVFQGKKHALYWFGAFLSLVLIAFMINDYLPRYIDWNLENSFINALFLLNIFGISTIVFLIQYYFVEKQKELQDDIEQKNTALEEQSEKLKEMDKVKSRFFANISHEFRTPLTLILGMVNKQIANPEDPPNPRDNDAMKRNSQRLLQLINQLLDLSKLESGEVRLGASLQDVVAFAKNITAQFESFAAGKNITLNFNGKDLHSHLGNDGIELYFDKEKLQKVLTNLLSNAMKFSPEGGEVGVDIQENKNAEQILIEVRNTGTEIPKEKLSFIFDRFYQVDSASNRQYEGTGIGLALVKELVELHHGKVEVESENGLTCFTIALPLGKAHLKEEELIRAMPVEGANEDSSTVFKQTTDANSEVGKQLKELEEKTNEEQLEILIVEDNADLRRFIRGILEKEYKVMEAVDGLDGFAQAESTIPDLIVSDVMMPRMDGYALCEKLKTNDKTNHIPVILLTAKAARENKLEGLQLGADDYLVKPFDEEELLVRIKNLVSIREKLQQKYQQEVSLGPQKVKITSVQQKFLEQIKEIIEKNIDNDQFSVEDLGSEIAMSRSQVHRKLKALTDQSATTFIRNYRLHRAADLLKQEAGNVTEIAYQVGFSSQTYFSSSFQTLFGCSPSEYKENNNSNL